ncbi:hypothetical protein [Kineosporia succinea]|uniref:Uncharacterized protein n=1 Tax=Kineosporia succinea TaxID=84632 RepID=A0ABT9NX51_9ACTN|nr:hypothetical protein [Kineosporia succinea]MDP9824420.1 hypothetical protein [Kineosporia succinea]
MAVLSPAAPSVATPSQRGRLLFIAALVLAALTAWIVSPLVSGDETREASAPALAARAGCSDTYRPTAGLDADHSGSCTLADGVRVDFRIWDTQGEANAWLTGVSGNSGQGQGQAGIVGGSWAAHITGTGDRDAINRILADLQR